MNDIRDIMPFCFQTGDDNDTFGASELTESQVRQFPDPKHRLIERGIFSRQRGIDDFLKCLNSERQHSIVTGIGPSGSMHIGHIIPLYFAKYIQNQSGARVYIPVSDDEKYLTRDSSMQTIQDYATQNIRDVLAVGFDPSNTRIIIDTSDADIMYPLSVNFAKDINQSQVNSIFGSINNIGESFYPAIQCSHLLLPQLVYGEHSSIMLSGMDQDPYVRLARDVADKTRYPVNKPGSILSQYAPSLIDPNEKMSSSSNEPIINLNDSRSEVETKIIEHAYSGGKKLREEHEKEGGNPYEDIPYSLLYYFFEEDDDELRRIYDEYKNGNMLSGEIKEIAVDKVWDFISEHQARKKALGSLKEELQPYRLTNTERQSALTRVGYSTELDINN